MDGAAGVAPGEGDRRAGAARTVRAVGLIVAAPGAGARGAGAEGLRPEPAGSPTATAGSRHPPPPPGYPAPVLSAVIIARDEADRIEAAVRSVAFADEVLVLDSGSTDATVARAEAAGARVVRTDWPGFVAQKNRGLALASGDWVLSIDADEVVDDTLRAAVIAALAAPAADGFVVRRRTIWLGHRLRHGFAWPDPRLRLVRKAVARWGGVDPHDRLDVTGRLGELPGELVHTPYRDLGEHLATIDRYTALDARAGSWLDVLVRPPWHFFRAYVLKLGVLDGVPGLVFAALGALYVLLKWTRGRGAAR